MRRSSFVSNLVVTAAVSLKEVTGAFSAVVVERSLTLTLINLIEISFQKTVFVYSYWTFIAHRILAE